MHPFPSRPRRRSRELLALAPLALALAACSRDPAPVATAPAAAPATAPAVVPESPAVAAVASTERMDCMGAGGIRFAVDFNAGQPRAFEYASSNPADRSIVCRYIASEGDATSTWERSPDGTVKVAIGAGSTEGAARFALAPSADGWRVEIVAKPETGLCFRTPPPDLMVLTGRPGQECSLTAQGGIAASANLAAEQQTAACAAERVEVASAPSQSQDPAAIFRELPERIVGMSSERREQVLAQGSARLEQLDPAAGYLSIERELKSYDDRDDADGYRIGTFRDSAGRTVVAVSTIGATAAKQGIWRADATGWQRVGCELIGDYQADHQYVPAAGGKALEVFDASGQPKGRLTWNGDKFVAA